MLFLLVGPVLLVLAGTMTQNLWDAVAMYQTETRDSLSENDRVFSQAGTDLEETEIVDHNYLISMIMVGPDTTVVIDNNIGSIFKGKIKIVGVVNGGSSITVYNITGGKEETLFVNSNTSIKSFKFDTYIEHGNYEVDRSTEGVTTYTYVGM